MGLFDFFKKDIPARPTAKPVKTRGFFSRMYNAAKNDLKTASWPSYPVHIDFIIKGQQRTMVARSREQYANNDYVKNYIRIVKRNVIGPNGITMQVKATDPNGKLDHLANQAIEAAWADWGKLGNCDVTGKLSWLRVQNLWAATAARDGECMLRFVYGKDVSPWGFAVQMIDPQRIPVFLEVENLEGGGYIRNGIEFNKFGRPMAYYFTTQDTPEHAYWGIGSPDYFLRVPAEDIIHDFMPEFISQKRGIPWAASALWRLRMINGFEDAAISNARAGAGKMGFFSRDYETAEEIADKAAKESAVDEDGNPCPVEEDEEFIIDASEPGVFETLPFGYKFEKYDPTYPSGEFDPFNKAMLRGASVGMGVSYHSLTNDLTDVNFSSIRQGALDERDEWMTLQSWAIEGLHERVYAKWLSYALLAKKIKVNGNPLNPSKADKYKNVTWQGRRWQWIDPGKDVTAAVTSVDKLLRSPSDIIREQGRDPQDVWAEYARDMESMKNSGLPEDLIMKFISGNVQPEPKANADDAGDERPPRKN